MQIDTLQHGCAVLPEQPAAFFACALFHDRLTAGLSIRLISNFRPAIPLGSVCGTIVAGWQGAMGIGFDQLQALTDTPGIGCEERHQLSVHFTSALRELVKLQNQQIEAVIRTDPDFARFDLLIHMAAERKREAKYALLSHMETHRC